MAVKLPGQLDISHFVMMMPALELAGIHLV